MKKLAYGVVGLVLAAWVLMGSVPAFAGEGAVSRPLTRIEFGSAFHGLDSKLVDRKYTEYRNGQIPAPTLAADSMR